MFNDSPFGASSSFSFADLDLSGVQASTGGGTLQPGKHLVKIADASVGQNSNKTGLILTVKFSNDEGAIKTTYNVKHNSAEATRIGLEQLKSLLVAAKHPSPDRPGDISSLKGLAVGIVVKKDGTYVKDGETKDSLKVAYAIPAEEVAGQSAQVADDDLKNDLPF